MGNRTLTSDNMRVGLHILHTSAGNDGHIYSIDYDTGYWTILWRGSGVQSAAWSPGECYQFEILDDDAPTKVDQPCRICQRPCGPTDKICWWCGQPYPCQEPRLTADHITFGKRVKYTGRANSEAYNDAAAFGWMGKRGTIVDRRDAPFQPAGVIFTVKFDDGVRADFNAPEVFSEET